MSDESTDLFTLIEDDGSKSLIDLNQAQQYVNFLVTHMLVTSKESEASKELMRISAETKSSAYTRWIAEEACKLLVAYLLEEAGTFQIPFALSHLNHFILAYRIVRPVTNQESSPEGEK